MAALARMSQPFPVVTVEGGHDLDVPGVALDQFAGARLVTEHLLALGHTSVWHVAGPRQWIEAEGRFQGWLAALEAAGLRAPDITFWTLWEDGLLAGCGALKELSPAHGEIKSMRTAPGFRRRGVAATLLHHILGEARRRGYGRVSLETGSMPYFAPARELYRGFGFEVCGPFAGYKLDPNSIFMTKALGLSDFAGLQFRG